MLFPQREVCQRRTGFLRELSKTTLLLGYNINILSVVEKASEEKRYAPLCETEANYDRRTERQQPRATVGVDRQGFRGRMPDLQFDLIL